MSFFVSGCSLSPHEKSDVPVWPQALKNACQKMASSYPFSTHSQREISVDAFDRYFSPDGLVQQYEHRLDHQGPTTAKVSNHLTAVKAIRDVFYKDSSSKASFSIKIKTHTRPEQLGRATTFFGKLTGVAMNGPRFYRDFTWTANTGPVSIKAWLYDEAETTWLKEYKGVWAWFRFWDSGAAREELDGTMIITVPMANVALYEYQIKGFFDWRKLRDQFSCP